MRLDKLVRMDTDKRPDMRLNIYKRPVAGGEYSYLAVPEGQLIPEEATNVDWEAAEHSISFADSEKKLAEYAIEDPIAQINAKGYAITSVKNLPLVTPEE